MTEKSFTGTLCLNTKKRTKLFRLKRIIYIGANMDRSSDKPLSNAVVLAFYSPSTHFRSYRLSSIIFLYSVHGQAARRQHIVVQILLLFNDNCSSKSEELL